MSPTSKRRSTSLGDLIGELTVRHRVACIAVVVLGVVLRVGSLTRLGLFQDDAWVALTGRYRLHTAIQMAATTPGFIAVMHMWLPLNPLSTLWAQAIPFAFGIAAMPLMYLAARAFALSVGWSITAMGVLAVAPVPVATSGHVKAYTIDCCVGALTLLCAETWRRSRTPWGLDALVATSIVGFALSASTVVVTIAAWLVVALDGLRVPKIAGKVLIRTVLVGLSLVIIAVAFLRHLPSALHSYWSIQGNFLDLTHPSALVHHTSVALRGVVSGLLAPWHLLPHYYVVQAALILVLFVAGASAWSQLRLPLLAIGTALLLSALNVIPFGTGRTDEVLYPSMIVVLCVGAIRLAGTFAARRADAGRWLLILGTVAVVTVSVAAVTTHRGYPAVNVRGLVGSVAPFKDAGDFTEVDGFTRYPWALYEDPHARLIFSPGYGAGFTVASSRPLVFIQPAQSYEAGYHPKLWALQAARHDRVWYVETPADPKRLADAFSAALENEGFERRRVVRSTGVDAVLYVRVTR